MSLPTALALVSLLMSGFAVLAVGAVYARLRMLERTALSPQSAMLVDEVRLVPEALRPTQDRTSTVVLLLNDSCALCHLVWQTASEHATTPELSAARVVGLFATGDAASSFEETPAVERTVDADLWAGLSEGYTPCVFTIDSAGRVADRRFVYGDTDVPGLLAEFAAPSVPTLESSGSSRAL